MYKNQKFAVLFVSSILMFACQTPGHRNPSSIGFRPDLQKLKELKQKDFELGALAIHYEKKQNVAELEKVRLEQTEIKNQMIQLESKLSINIDSQTDWFEHKHEDWRKEEEKIELRQLNLYQKEKKVEFSVSTFESKETVINLTHKIFAEANFVSANQEDPKPKLEFKVQCSSPIQMKYGFNNKKLKANEALYFSLGDKKLENDYRTFIVDSKFESCNFSFISSIDTAQTPYEFKLVNETKKLSKFDSILNRTEVCGLNNNEDFINNGDFYNLNCPHPYDSIKILPEPEDSLMARVEALTGSKLPADFIKKANPYGALDMSKAPKLDAIFVSYLVFRADFYGTLLSQLLAYHADRGTIVRVIVSDVITLDKDKLMYERMMAKHPNIKFVRYEFDKSQKGGSLFAQLHRTNHVKLFIAYSKDDESASSVIVGGRNVHDGFAFKSPVDVSAYPEVVNYLKGDESWAYWRDFEMVIKGQEFVEGMVAHYLNFYHINKENLVMRPTAVTLKNANAKDVDTKNMRHYISIPFKDTANLNQFYAKMIDSAKKKILISSPYFRPVKEIGEALDRAIQRGVDISIITRLDLEGDTADFILGAVNKDGVNKFSKKVKVYEYIEPKVILHSKLLMIDDEVTFVSSVNLNKRSFYHDMENGVVVNDKDFTVEMGELYKKYLELCKPIKEEMKIEFWKRWLIKVVDKVF